MPSFGHLVGINPSREKCKNFLKEDFVFYYLGTKEGGTPKATPFAFLSRFSRADLDLITNEASRRDLLQTADLLFNLF